MSFNVNNDTHSRLVKARQTHATGSVESATSSTENKQTKKVGGMFSRLLSTLRVKLFGKRVESQSVESDSLRSNLHISSATPKGTSKSDTNTGIAQHSVNMIVHNNNVVALKVDGKMMSLDEARNISEPSAELKTTLAALDRGTNEKTKSGRAKIGSKLYVNGDKVSVRTSVFGDKRKIVAGKTSITDISKQLNQELLPGNYSNPVTISTKKIITQLKFLHEFSTVSSDKTYETHLTALNSDIKEGLASLPEDLTDETFAHFNNVLEKFALLETIGDQVDTSSILKSSITEFKAQINDKKALFEKIKTFKELKQTLTENIKTHPDSKASALVKSNLAEISKEKNWDNKISLLKTSVSLLDKSYNFEDQFGLIQQKTNVFGKQVQLKLIRFETALDQVESLPEYNEKFETGLPPLTKEIATAAVADTATHVAQMKENVVNLHSEYQKGVNFGFKKMLFSYKERFEKRFDYLNSQALSLDNVEIKQDKAGISDPPGFTKEAKQSLFNEIKELYLEKKFGSIYRTHAGSQYTDWANQVRTDSVIDSEISAKLSQANYTDPSQMKAVTDSIFQEGLDSIKSSFANDASQFIVTSFAKDAYYSTLRAQSEMVSSLEQNLTDFEAVISDQSASSIVETSPGRLIDELVDFNNLASTFQSFSTAYLVGKQADHLISKQGLSLIVDDYLSKHPNIKVPSNDLKQKFVDYSYERLKRKAFITESGQFNLDKTLTDVTNFTFRVNTKNIKAGVKDALSTRVDRDIYKENFAQQSVGETGSEGKAFFKALVPDGAKDGFDSFLKTKLNVTVTDRGQYAEQRRMLAQLELQKSSVEEFASGAKLKTEVWGVQFKQADPIGKLKMLFKAKDEIASTIEDVTDDSTHLESNAEEVNSTLESAANAISKVEGQLDHINSQVEAVTQKMSNAASQLDRFENLLAGMQNKKSSQAAVDELSSSVMTSLAGVKENVTDVINTVSPYLGEASDIVAEGADTILANVPFYNQLEGAAAVLVHLGKAGYSASQLKQFAEVTNKVTTLNTFGTASNVEGGPAELQDSIDAFADYMKTQGNVNKELLNAAFSLANAISPPGIKLGKLMSKVNDVFSLGDVSEEKMKEISKEVSSINDDFASLSTGTNADIAVRNKEIEAKAASFLHRLDVGDLDQIVDKVVDSSDSTKMAVTFYKVAQSYQDLAFSGGSSAQIRPVIKRRYSTLITS